MSRYKRIDLASFANVGIVNLRYTRYELKYEIKDWLKENNIDFWFDDILGSIYLSADYEIKFRLTWM